MTSREIVKNTILFKGAERFPYEFPEKYGSDFSFTDMSLNPDFRPCEGIDEWGCIWENIGISKLGEVKHFPLKHWNDMNKINIPDIKDPGRWKSLKKARKNAGDKFLLGNGISLYERVHFIRGLENTWMDIHENLEELSSMIDILVEMNIYSIKQYANAGFDGYIFCDDWGLQDRLMISPKSWRKIWKPKYAKVYQAAHEAGLLTFLHSCGDITAILDDLIEAGLDVIQMDQQENMGLDNLNKNFSGRLTFWCPVDIQKTMVEGNSKDIKKYCRDMLYKLGTQKGGFMAKWYPDSIGAGHTQEAVNTMCNEFINLTKKHHAV
jgi:uroporphyrinogen decarboxylase